MTSNRLRTFFWTIDPGYFQLKQAAKTVFAILLALWFVRNEATITQIMAGMICGISMQGVVAKSFFSRVIQVVIFDIAYFVAFALGLAMRGSPHWIMVGLVVLGFAVNYVRRFDLDNSMAPMMTWLLFFFATILPFPRHELIQTQLYGILIGFSVSAVIILFIFPENYAHLFLTNANRFFQGLSQGLNEIGRDVLAPTKKARFQQLPFMTIKASLTELLDSNQLIQQSHVFAKKHHQTSMILLYQYALLGAYSLIVDAYHSLWMNRQQVSPAVVLVLNQISQAFAELFSGISVREDYSVDSKLPIVSLPKLGAQLGHLSLTDPEKIMVLLNFKLSFDLLNQHVEQLLRGADET